MSDPRPAPPKADPEAALRHALRGIDLDAHDERIIGWAATMLDDPTVRTVLSWLERVRDAGATEGER